MYIVALTMCRQLLCIPDCTIIVLRTHLLFTKYTYRILSYIVLQLLVALFFATGMHVLITCLTLSQQNVQVHLHSCTSSLNV